MPEAIKSLQGTEIVVEAESVDGVPVKKVEIIHVCSDCDSISDHFRCRCPKCGGYNTLEEHDKSMVVMSPLRYAVPVWTAPDVGRMGVPGAPVTSAWQAASGNIAPQNSKLLSLGELEAMGDTGRVLTGESSLDFMLGGGMVLPSVIMIGGDPGVGKSTLLTQVFGAVGHQYKCYYAAGEEAPLSISTRIKRVAAIDDRNRENCKLRRGGSFLQVMRDLNEHKPKLVIFDSLQAHLHERVDGTGERHKRGSAAQIVPMAKELHDWAHANEAIVWIVCHVTKGGDFAGPNTVDHDVDAHVMLVKMDDGRIAAMSEKNRFGSTDVVGMFEMRENGLKSV